MARRARRRQNGTQSGLHGAAGLHTRGPHLPYSPLGKGFLTGKIEENAKFDSTDFRSVLPRFAPEALKANQALVNLLNQIAQRKNATPGQIALAWLLAQKPRSHSWYDQATSA